jgi:hypothetical protein
VIAEFTGEMGNATRNGATTIAPEFDSLLKVPVAVQPLLCIQRLTHEGIPALCVSKNFRECQRFFYENIRGRELGDQQSFIVHERMPAYQRDYVMDCLDAYHDFALTAGMVVFTTDRFMSSLCERLPWLTSHADVITGDTFMSQSAASSATSRDETTVSCICLREGQGGRWLLTDHDDAATVQPDRAPEPELVNRLLRHTVQISGDRLAPYLALMFDVPPAWKAYPELAVQSLLVFRRNVCPLGCVQPGIPDRIFWSELIGLVY